MTEQITQMETKSSLRVNVGLLDDLMNLAGELVLSRNQLLQGINSSNTKSTELSSQRIDLITSELQEAIMQTRMQPIENILNKYARVIRDLSHQLGKSIDLVLEGKDVELDKTILETINDPLTHLVRNAVDHGIEMPEQRRRNGKEQTGKITIKAFHDAGQVNIIISDDGQGLDPHNIGNSAVSKGLITEKQVQAMTDKQKMELIFMPGFSTAKEVTDISGRGVGMDVVITNIESLGGVIELDSVPGKGTDIQIKLPLTLAIIPSQITSVENERYAIPQVNLDELLRITASEVAEKIERVGDADVVRLRGELLPLVDLAQVLGMEKTYVDPETSEIHPERRMNISDRRSKNHLDIKDVNPKNSSAQIVRSKEDRRKQDISAVHIAVVSAGTYKYGLVVDQLHDSEEIVVKPVGRHLKKCQAYAGATIMGDGKVALILDISNIAQMAKLFSLSDTMKALEETQANTNTVDRDNRESLLTFKNSDSEYFAVPIDSVERIERIQTAHIERIGQNKVVQYRGGALVLFELSQIGDFKPLPEKQFREVLVFRVNEREVGLLVSPPLDSLETVMDIDKGTLAQPGIVGSVIVNGHTTLLLDISAAVDILSL